MIRGPDDAKSSVPHNAARAPARNRRMPRARSSRCARLRENAGMNRFFSYLAIGVTVMLSTAGNALHAQALQKIVFSTDWLAQAEHGGFYQAVAEGTYRKYGLDVADPDGRAAGQRTAIARRGPARRRDGRCAAGVVRRRARACRSSRSPRRSRRIRPSSSRIPACDGSRTSRASRSRSARRATRRSGRGCEQKYGFTDDQKRPYGFSVQPFLADPALSQQGFVTSEPFSIEKGGVQPVGVPAGGLRLSAVFGSARRHAQDARRPPRCARRASFARPRKAGRATSPIRRRAMRSSSRRIRR